MKHFYPKTLFFSHSKTVEPLSDFSSRLSFTRPDASFGNTKHIEYDSELTLNFSSGKMYRTNISHHKALWEKGYEGRKTL